MNLESLNHRNITWRGWRRTPVARPPAPPPPATGAPFQHRQRGVQSRVGSSLHARQSMKTTTNISTEDSYEIFVLDRGFNSFLEFAKTGYFIMDHCLLVSGPSYLYWRAEAGVSLHWPMTVFIPRTDSESASRSGIPDWFPSKYIITSGGQQTVYLTTVTSLPQP